MPGTDPEAGSYIICAHYDATAVRTSDWDWEKDPAPGADDNASGVARRSVAASVCRVRATIPYSAYDAASLTRSLRRSMHLILGESPASESLSWLVMMPNKEPKHEALGKTPMLF